MIRKIAVALSLGGIAAIAPLGAQTSIGIVGGYVGSSVSYKPAVAGLTWSSKSGFAVGLSLGFLTSGSLSLNAEGLYVQKGANAAGGGFTGSEKVNYLEVPVLLRYNLTSGTGPRFFLMAGGQYSKLLSCTTSVAGLADVDCKASGDLKGFDYGAVFGAGVTSGKITLTGRYDLGMQNLNSNATASDPTIKTRAFLALISIHR